MLSTLESFLTPLVRKIDMDVLAFAQSVRSDTLTVFFVLATFLASWQMTLAVMLGTFWYLPSFGRRIYRTGVFLSVGISEALAYLVKYIVERPRPYDALLNESTAAFPSGHTAVAIALYGFIAWVLYREAKTPGGRYAAAGLGIFVPVCVALSRLYLGVHYFSDVLAGGLVGMLGLLCAILYIQKKTIKGRA